MGISIVLFLFLYCSVCHATVPTQKITGTTFNSSFDAINSLRQNVQNNAVAIQNIIQAAVPGVSFPQLTAIPRTSFNCSNVQHNGFYADVDTGCQVYRRCRGPRMQSYLCPNRTLFNQITLTCDWWYNVNCSKSRPFYMFSNGRLYNHNERLLDDSGLQSNSGGKVQANQGPSPFTISVRTSSPTTDNPTSNKMKVITTKAATLSTSTLRTAPIAPPVVNATTANNLTSVTHPTSTVSSITGTIRQGRLEPGSGDPITTMSPNASLSSVTASFLEQMVPQPVASISDINHPARLEPQSEDPVPLTPPSARLTKDTAGVPERPIPPPTVATATGINHIPHLKPGSEDQILTKLPNGTSANVTNVFSAQTTTQTSIAFVTGINRPAGLEPRHPGNTDLSPMTPQSVSLNNATDGFPEWLITQPTVATATGINHIAHLEPGSADRTITRLPNASIANVTAGFPEQTTRHTMGVSVTGVSRPVRLEQGNKDSFPIIPQSVKNVTTDISEWMIAQPTVAPTNGSNRLARLDPLSVHSFPATSTTNVTDFPEWTMTADTTEITLSDREVLIDFDGRARNTVLERHTLVAELHSGHSSTEMNGPLVLTGNTPPRQGKKISDGFPFLDYFSMPSLNVSKSNGDMEFYMNGERYGLKIYLKHQLIIPFAACTNHSSLTAGAVHTTPASFRQLRRMA